MQPTATNKKNQAKQQHILNIYVLFYTDTNFTLIYIHISSVQDISKHSLGSLISDFLLYLDLL